MKDSRVGCLKQGQSVGLVETQLLFFFTPLQHIDILSDNEQSVVYSCLVEVFIK